MALKEGQHDKSDKWHYVPINMSSSDVITSSFDVVTTGAKDRPEHTRVLFTAGNAGLLHPEVPDGLSGCWLC